MKFFYFSFLFLFFISSCKKDNKKEEQPPASDWTFFSSSNSSLAPSDAINTLFIDNSGILWVSAGWLNRYDGNSWSKYDQSNTGIFLSWVTGGVNLNNVNWFSTMAGLAKQQSGIWTLQNTTNSPLPSSGINGIVVDASNNLWMATDMGVVRYDGASNWNIYDDSNTPMTCKFVKHIKKNPDGSIWIASVLNNVVCPGAVTGCVAKYCNGNWTVFTSLNSSLPTGEVSTLDIDNNGVVWLAIEGQLIRFNGISFEIFNSSNSILPPATSNTIYDIAFDMQNNLWAGTLKGVFKFDGTSTWKTFNKQNSELPDDWVIAVAVDNSNTKLFGCLMSKVIKYTGN